MASRAWWAILLCGLSPACDCAGSAPDGGPNPDAGRDEVVRCETDLSAFRGGLFGAVSARRIGGADDFIGGPNAQARLGDYLIQNELVRFVIQGDGRLFGPLPFGGTVLDADLVRRGAGNDQLGELGLLYNFGRTLKPEHFEVLSSGDGQTAIVAITGSDAPNDYLSIRGRLEQGLGRVPYADPKDAVPLRITNYFVLAAHEQRLRYVTAFCNLGASTVSLAVGDLSDPGASVELFNPQSCTNGFGSGGVCFGLDRVPWYGYQGQGVAYGYAPYRVRSAFVPQPVNVMLTVAGISGVVVGSPGLAGLSEWTQDAGASLRAGELRLAPGERASLVRDVWVAETLGEISNFIERSRSSGLGTLRVDAQEAGAPLANARIAVEGAEGRTVLTTDARGTFSAQLRAGQYRVSAWAPGRDPSPFRQVMVESETLTEIALTLTPPRRLKVTVREVNGGPLPAKVTVLCNGPCPAPNRTLAPYLDIGPGRLPDFIQQLGFVPPSGTVELWLPPNDYWVLVSRGPEYSIWPNTYPRVAGEHVELRMADAEVNATLAKVVNTDGWRSADFHVHAVNSPDSFVDNGQRALGFAADGVDILVATDHDVITDYGPVVRANGLSPFLATVVGEEVSPMEFGHYNLFPLQIDARNPVNAGAIDWANADGLSLSPARIFDEGRRLGARTIQVNHPRGSLGGFTALGVDTDTLATHADPSLLFIEPMPGATSADSKLFSQAFNALELLNSAEDNLDPMKARGRFNDWFTLLSRGLRLAGTAVSDTHGLSVSSGWRSWVELPDGDTALLSERVNAGRLFGSNGPFVKLEVYRVDASGAQVTAAVGIGGTVAPDARRLGVTVDVQVPEYLDVTRVELYMHLPQDDASCPVSAAHPRANTARVACNGAENINWPASGITASQNVSLSPGDLEVATTAGGVTYRRAHVRVSFTLPAPTTDNWVVAFVYGSRTLAPLLYPAPGLTGSVGSAAPFAFTNPVFIDADGQGYDKPPFTADQRPSPTPQPLQHAPPNGLSPIERWGRAFGHD